MSSKGKLLRGEKWFLMNRDKEGNLLKVIKEDATKMVDVNLFLEAKKREDEEKAKSKRKK